MPPAIEPSNLRPDVVGLAVATGLLAGVALTRAVGGANVAEWMTEGITSGAFALLGAKINDSADDMSKTEHWLTGFGAASAAMVDVTIGRGTTRAASAERIVEGAVSALASVGSAAGIYLHQRRSASSASQTETGV